MADEYQNTEKVDDWNDQQPGYVMEGFFDYKNNMINPAAKDLSLAAKNPELFVKKAFTIINRDLQLGNLSPKDYTTVFRHFNLGIELIKNGMCTAGISIIQKGYMLLVMSNSKTGFMRRLESTNISVRKVENAGGSQSGGGLRFWEKKKKI